jgi:hypothetical protein
VHCVEITMEKTHKRSRRENPQLHQLGRYPPWSQGCSARARPPIAAGAWYKHLGGRLPVLEARFGGLKSDGFAYSRPPIPVPTGTGHRAPTGSDRPPAGGGLQPTAIRQTGHWPHHQTSEDKNDSGNPETPYLATAGYCWSAGSWCCVLYTQSSVLRNANLRNHWWGGARKRIHQKGSEPGNAITPGDPP